jgi:hypothetical protein
MLLRFAHLRRSTRSRISPRGKPEPKPASHEAAEPPNIILHDHQLTIETNNSDLGQTLAEVAEKSGMVIHGNVASTRIFGSYGPGKPSAVISDLLAGSGCNFMMVGALADGVPRELELTPRGAAATPSVTSKESLVAAGEDHSEDVEPAQDAPGPGAVVHAPPSGPDDPEERSRQNLQRLQQMRQQQQGSPQ